MAIDFSGVKRWVEPSRWDLNVTPSASMRRVSLRLKTWKPPLSVRMGPSQAMKRCSPPRSRMSSSPGRR